MVDVVLNRRILIVLIPALEKSADETANLGKIVAATIKGMMGSTLGATVEGESATVIENKPTHSSTPFMTIFDEVGYYTAARYGRYGRSSTVPRVLVLFSRRRICQPLKNA
jgi:intracellular multiplication protein IcmO